MQGFFDGADVFIAEVPPHHDLSARSERDPGQEPEEAVKQCLRALLQL